MNAFIVDGIRTGIGSLAGTLSAVRADDLASFVLKSLVARHPGLNVEAISDVIMGCANQAGEDNRNVARMAVLLAGLPYTIPGETVNRLCASGMSAVIGASRAAHAGEGDLFIAGGVEHMTRGPWVISKTTSPYGRDAQMFDSSFGWRFVNPRMEKMYGVDSMGDTAENLAQLYSVNREDQDIFSCWSQNKAAQASASGRLAKEIEVLSIPLKKGEVVSFGSDEFMKPASSVEVLGKLRPAFRPDGTVTAGNAAGLNDGAAALLICSEEGLKTHNLQPQCRVVSSAVVGVEPRIMGIGPVGASRLALKRAGLSLDQVDIIEINEAFAAQVLACTRQLGLQDNDDRINPNGGSIALGHPLGMTGARLIQTAAIELQLKQKKYALCTMCIGVGQGYAVVLERA